MKTATIPPLRVDPGLRKDVESVLTENESISKFTESAIRAQVELRKAQSEFIARGLASRDNALNTGIYVSSKDALLQLENMLKNVKSIKK